MGRVEPLGPRKVLTGCGPAGPARPQLLIGSQLHLLWHAECVLDLDPEITDGAFELCMSKEKLNHPQVAGLLVNLSWFCPSHRVGAIG